MNGGVCACVCESLMSHTALSTSLPLSLPQIGALEQQVEDFSQKLKSAELLLAESEAHTQTLVEH